jgi:hypothetical protein
MRMAFEDFLEESGAQRVQSHDSCVLSAVVRRYAVGIAARGGGWLMPSQ